MRKGPCNHRGRTGLTCWSDWWSDKWQRRREARQPDGRQGPVFARKKVNIHGYSEPLEPAIREIGAYRRQGEESDEGGSSETHLEKVLIGFYYGVWEMQEEVKVIRDESVEMIVLGGNDGRRNLSLALYTLSRCPPQRPPRSSSLSHHASRSYPINNRKVVRGTTGEGPADLSTGFDPYASRQPAKPNQSRSIRSPAPSAGRRA